MELPYHFIHQGCVAPMKGLSLSRPL